mgnify:CR=1 FL=1
MKTIVIIVAGIAAAVILYSMFALTVRQFIAFLKGDGNELDRLTMPYDIVEMMAKRDFGISSEVFELMWNDLKAAQPNALPWDLYLKIKESK